MNRRSLDEQAERAGASKLAHIPECVWTRKFNSDGESILQVAKRTLDKFQGDNTKLGSKFWAGLFHDFELHEFVADALADPPEDLPVDRELMVALNSARNGNQHNAKAPAIVERHLEHCQAPNRAEVFGLLGAVMEGPTLSRPLAARLHVAALRYIARTQAHQ